MLRLGHKYQIEHLRQDAVTRLGRYFPISLDDFHLNIRAAPGKQFPGDAIIDICPEDSIAVISMAQALELPRLLPTAFYVCAQLDWVVLVDGHKDADGTLWKLSQEELKRVLVGKAELERWSTQQMDFILLAELAPTCVHPPVSCASHLEATREEHINGTSGVYFERPGGLQDASWIRDLHLCNMCETYHTENCHVVRQSVWDDLASVFDLQDVEWPIEEEDE